MARGLGDTQDFEVFANLRRGTQRVLVHDTQSSAHAPHPASETLPLRRLQYAGARYAPRHRDTPYSREDSPHLGAVICDR
jgi:hypothetical protein